MDQPGELIQLSVEELALEGTILQLDDFMGIPIVTVTIAGTNYRMFFDTGAQISYFQDESLTQHPRTGSMEDFYPGFGQFSTVIYAVPIVLEDHEETPSFGKLPDDLSASLALANTKGIIGNELVMGKRVGYFPRRNKLWLYVAK